MKRVGFVAFVLLGCINEERRLYEVNLVGEVAVATAPGEGTLHLELHHAWTGEGVLRTPLGWIDDTELPAGRDVSWTTLVPLGEGEGLVIYGWLDIDGDGLLCAPGTTSEPAGVVLLDGFPAHRLTFSLTLDTACAGPSALYPP